MLYVKKRDGRVVKFDIKKISEAMKKAFDATSTHYTDDVLELLSLKVVADFQNKVQNKTVDIEDVQDSVERMLEF